MDTPPSPDEASLQSPPLSPASSGEAGGEVDVGGGFGGGGGSDDSVFSEESGVGLKRDEWRLDVSGVQVRIRRKTNPRATGRKPTGTFSLEKICAKKIIPVEKMYCVFFFSKVVLPGPAAGLMEATRCAMETRHSRHRYVKKYLKENVLPEKIH